MMKKKFSAYLLTAGLTLGLCGGSVFAQEIAAPAAAPVQAAAEAAPAAQQPAAAAEQPAAAVQQPVAAAQQPAAAAQQPAAVAQQPAAVAEQPAAAVQQPVAEQPAAAVQQPVAEQPAAVVQQPVAQQPVAAAEQPAAAAQQPVAVAEQPAAAAEQPAAVAQQPAAAAQQPAAVAEQPAAAAEELAVAAEEETMTPEEQQNAENARVFAETLIFRMASSTEEELDELRDTGSDSMKIAIANWDAVSREVGQPLSILSQDVTVSEDGKTYTVVSDVRYDGVSEKTKVTDTVTLNQRTQDFTLDIEIDYPKSKLFGEAALNTLMGLGTVFVVLIFLSWLISQIHWIPDLIEKRSKKADAASPKVPANAAVSRMNAAETEPDGEIVTDSELIAVIAAAIAAYEGTTVEKVMADGFVVRTIKKSNRENWLRA